MTRIVFLVVLTALFLANINAAFAQTFTDVSNLLAPGAPDGARTGQRGASAADFNNDGLVDIYHANFRDPGRLYLNQIDPANVGSGFVDILGEIELEEGENMWGAAFGDYDNDGYLDILFEDLSGHSKLYHNDRTGSFTEVNNAAGVNVNTLAQGAAWGDFNLDGTLDFLIVNDVGPNQLFKNLDFFTFADISQSANVQTIGNSYGISWGDINNDGFPDAYIATCHGFDPLRSINHLLLNNGDETFTNIGPAAGVADSLAGWSVLFFDYDQDFDLDLFVTNSYHAPRSAQNRLYRNNGDLTFTNVSVAAGVAGNFDESSYGASIADFDNDGWEDIFVTELPHKDRLYHNNGDGTFTDISDSAGIELNEHRAGAVADFNNDGWIDIFTTGTPANRLLFNNGSTGTNGGNHWLGIRCRGVQSNIFGVGTRIELFVDSLRQVREIRAGDSFCSQNLDVSAHFGLGQFTVIDSLILRWPSGQIDKYTNFQAIDQQLIFVEGGGLNHRPGTFKLTTPAKGDTLRNVGQGIEFGWTYAFDPDKRLLSYRLHISAKDLLTGEKYDTTFSDISGNSFIVPVEMLRDNHQYRWSVDAGDGISITAAMNPGNFILNPLGELFQLSAQTLGDITDISTGVSWGDIDNDGDEDVFIANQSGKNTLFANDGAGNFTQITTGGIVADDGNSFTATWGANEQNNFLYQNNGDGTFFSLPTSIPASDGGNSTSASWVDFDNDGNLDLFVANAGSNPNFLYQNNGDSTFSKITNGEIVTETGNSFGNAWADYDSDGDADLFVANSQKNFLYQNNGDGSFAKITGEPVVDDAGISRGGSWGDYDNDGDPDLYVVNIGVNFLYRNDGFFGASSVFTRITTGVIVEDNLDSRSSLWLDVDNDGDLDLFVSNVGINALYLNNGAVNGAEINFTKLLNGELVNDAKTSNAVASADIDNDGDLDMLVTNMTPNAANALYVNSFQSNHWLKVKCVGAFSNPSAIGAKVRVRSRIRGKDVWQLREISGQSGFAAQSSLVAHFGLGNAQQVDSLVIEWPSQRTSILTNLNINQFLTISEDSAITAIDEKTLALPKTFVLKQNHPNPFNPETGIKYQLSISAEVTLTVFDMLGRKIRTLVNTQQTAGSYEIVWNGRNDAGETVGSGIYLYRLSASGQQQVKKMLLVR